MTAWRWRLFGALLPVLGLLALVVRGELAARAGPRFRLAITGFDPRDLLSGRYLNYRYELDWQGESSCGAGSAGRPPAIDPSCCVCFTAVAAAASPSARQVECTAVQLCDGWLRGSELVPPRRYYVPEDRALELEQALAGRKPALDVTTSRSGRAAVGELYLDGRPWRDALPKP